MQIEDGFKIRILYTYLHTQDIFFYLFVFNYRMLKTTQGSSKNKKKTHTHTKESARESVLVIVRNIVLLKYPNN